MTTTVQKHVNSSDLTNNSGVSISVSNGVIIIEPKAKLLDLKEVMKNYKPEIYHSDISWGESVGREIL